MCACMHVHDVCMCAYRYVRISTHACVYLCMYVCIHVYVCMYKADTTHAEIDTGENEAASIT